MMKIPYQRTKKGESEKAGKTMELTAMKIKGM